MPKDIHTQDSSQQRASRLLLAMGVIVLWVRWPTLG